MKLAVAIAYSAFLAAVPGTVNDPHRVSQAARRVILSDGQTVDAYVHQHLYNGADGQTIVGQNGIAVLRLADGYSIGAFFKGDGGKVHPSYFEIWDKNVKNVLSLSVDPVASAKPGDLPMTVTVNKKELRLRVGDQPSQAEGAREVRKAIASLPKKFEEAIRALLAVADSGKIDGFPPELQYLTNFMDVPDGVSVTHIEGLSQEQANEMHSFVTRSGIPGYTQPTKS